MNGNSSIKDEQGYYQIPEVRDVVSFDFGDEHALALKVDGTMVVWGHNRDGNVAFSSKLPIPSKVTKINGLSQIEMMASSDEHVIAVTKSGQLYGWGRNLNNKLLPSNKKEVLLPTQIPGISNVKKVALGADFTLALTKDGSLYGWGLTDRLGLPGEIVIQPTKFENLPNDIIDVSASGETEVAVITTKSGLVYQLGGALGHLSDIYLPVSPELKIRKVSNLTNATEAGCGYITCYALTKDKTIVKWDNQIKTAQYKARKIEGFNKINKMYVGTANDDYIVGIDTNGGVWGLGGNQSHQLGEKASSVLYKPTNVSNFLGRAFTIPYNIYNYNTRTESQKEPNRKFIKGSTGKYEAYFINQDGDLLGGRANRVDESKSFNYRVKDVHASNNYMFVIKDDGSVWSYGSRNEFGQLGIGIKELYFNPITVPNLKIK